MARKWPSRLPMARKGRQRHLTEIGSDAGVEHSQPEEKWWNIHLFEGMINDIKRRAPYYLSDWTDAWDYRVVPATVYMYFAK